MLGSLESSMMPAHVNTRLSLAEDCWSLSLPQVQKGHAHTGLSSALLQHCIEVSNDFEFFQVQINQHEARKNSSVTYVQEGILQESSAKLTTL